MSQPAFTILTIGHSNLAWEAFTELLRAHEVGVVADVRSAPYSRFVPQFNRESLEAGLRAEAIQYVFLGHELGARSEDPSCYESGRVQYGRLAKTGLFQAGIDRLMEGRAKHRIALLCAEREPLECHRTLLIAHELVRGGAAVAHIHPDGHLETHEQAMVRLQDVVGVPRTDLFLSQEQLLAEAMRRQEERIAYFTERRSPEAEEDAR